jgi:hypothetical protein
MTDKDNPLDDLELPLPSPDDLRGRQSVRATFKLSNRAIDALSIVAAHLGIKQKSLFDHLIEDVDALNFIAKEIEIEQFRTTRRVQKTYVISRRTLSCLDRISREFDAPRDALVEYSIQRLMPVINRERKKHQRRKQVLEAVNAHLEDGLGLLDSARRLLGENDPVTARLEAAMSTYLSAQRTIEAYIEKGSLIEDF